MSDLARRLDAAGHVTTGDPRGVYGSTTTAAVEAFQEKRGLRVDGICGPQTWAALVEAGFRLGERLLYRSEPMLRGDDVADLQRRLGELGFDAGRIDGIFGTSTQWAVIEFQRNAGLLADGTCGAVTMQALLRLRSRGEGAPVGGVREREQLRSRPPTVDGCRIAIGETGGLDALVRTVDRAMRRLGALPAVLHHPDSGQLAALANALEADAYLGLTLDPRAEGVSTAYYAAHGFESAGGRRLAELVVAEISEALELDNLGARGMALPVLRETRMPAVVCEIGPPRAVVEGSQVIADALSRAVCAWTAAPCP